MIKDEKAIIQFDENVFLNKNGISQLGLEEHVTEGIYNHLYSQNMTSDGARAYVFIDRVLEFKNDYFKYRKFGLLPKLNKGFQTFRFVFRESLRDLGQSLFGGYLYEPLKVCGFFRFGALISYKKNSFIQLNGLPSYYLNKINQKPKSVSDCRAGLIHSKDVDFFHEDSNIRLLSNSSKSTEFERIHNELYFELADVLTAIEYQCGDTSLNNENIQPQMVFWDGLRSHNLDAVDEPSKEDNRNFPSPDMLVNQVAGLVSLIKLHLPSDFSKTEGIADELERLHPDTRGLTYSSLTKTLAKGNKEIRKTQ